MSETASERARCASHNAAKLTDELSSSQSLPHSTLAAPPSPRSACLSLCLPVCLSVETVLTDKGQVWQPQQRLLIAREVVFHASRFVELFSIWLNVPKAAKRTKNKRTCNQQKKTWARFLLKSNKNYNNLQQQYQQQQSITMAKKMSAQTNFKCYEW